MQLLRNVQSKAQQIDRRTVIALVVAVIVFAGIAAVFGLIGNAVADGQTEYIDEGALLFINGFANPVLSQIIIMITFFGGVSFVLVTMLMIALYYAQQRRWRPALFALFSIGGVLVANSVLKLVFQRERPYLWEWIIGESTYSFPSGHAALSCALALTVILLVWYSRWRWMAVVAGGVYVLLIGFTRLYLGVHYPSDIVAGWLVAMLWVGVIALIMGVIRMPTRRDDAHISKG